MKLWMAYTTFGFSVCLIAALALAGCQPAGTCNNSISGSNNFANCGGAGDGQDAAQTTPAPVIVPPVVITNPAPEPAP